MRYTFTPFVLDLKSGEVDNSLTDNEVNRNILDEKRSLTYPPAAPKPSKAFASLLAALLRRKAAARLGGTAAGAASVRAHPFFSGDGGVDWAAVAGGTHPMPPPPSKPAEEGGAGGLTRLESVDEAGAEAEAAEDDDDDGLDPISAQLVAFMKAKQRSEGSSVGSAEEAVAAPPMAKPPSVRQWGWASSASCSSLRSSTSDITSLSIDGFWEGPDWEEEGDAWDRDF